MWGNWGMERGTGSCPEARSSWPFWSINSKAKQGTKHCSGVLLSVWVRCWEALGLQVVPGCSHHAGMEEGPIPFCPGALQLSSPTQQSCCLILISLHKCKRLAWGDVGLGCKLEQ